MIETDLHLHEEILLLALDDAKGTIPFGNMWQTAAGGAIVAELLLRGRLRATDDAKKPKLEVSDRTPVGDPVLDDALAEIAAREKPRTGADWVQRFGTRGGLEKRIATGLVRRGVLREERGKVLWIFPTTRYPERDARPENQVEQRLERAIFTGCDDLAPRTVVLVALCAAADILPLVFDKARLKERKERIAQITDGSLPGLLATQAVEAIQAALMVATVIPAIMITTTTS